MDVAENFIFNIEIEIYHACRVEITFPLHVVHVTFFYVSLRELVHYNRKNRELIIIKLFLHHHPSRALQQREISLEIYTGCSISFLHGRIYISIVCVYVCHSRDRGPTVRYSVFIDSKFSLLCAAFLFLLLDTRFFYVFRYIFFFQITYYWIVQPPYSTPWVILLLIVV